MFGNWFRGTEPREFQPNEFNFWFIKNSTFGTFRGMSDLNYDSLKKAIWDATERPIVFHQSLTGVCTCRQWEGADRIVGGAIAAPHSLPYQVTR